MKVYLHIPIVLASIAISVAAAVELDKFSSRAQEYRSNNVVVPVRPILIHFPETDMNGNKLRSPTQVVSMGKGTCCSHFLDRAYGMSYDQRSKNVVFLIAESRQKPNKKSIGSFVVVGDEVPQPGYYVKTTDNRFIQTDFPIWWRNEK